jgi:hypothetical protein
MRRIAGRASSHRATKRQIITELCKTACTGLAVRDLALVASQAAGLLLVGSGAVGPGGCHTGALVARLVGTASWFR